MASDRPATSEMHCQLHQDSFTTLHKPDPWSEDGAWWGAARSWSTHHMASDRAATSEMHSWLHQDSVTTLHHPDAWSEDGECWGAARSWSPRHMTSDRPATSEMHSRLQTAALVPHQVSCGVDDRDCTPNIMAVEPARPSHWACRGTCSSSRSSSSSSSRSGWGRALLLLR